MLWMVRKFFRKFFRQFSFGPSVNDTRYLIGKCFPRYVNATLAAIGVPCDAEWPEWAIYWTLGKFLKPLATINLPNYSTFLGNFYKGVKIYNFSSEIIFEQLLQTFGNFFWSHCLRVGLKTNLLTKRRLLMSCFDKI